MKYLIQIYDFSQWTITRHVLMFTRDFGDSGALYDVNVNVISTLLRNSHHCRHMTASLYRQLDRGHT